MHIVMTANAAWNIAHFRRTLLEALIADSHRITVIAPSDPPGRKDESRFARFGNPSDSTRPNPL
jgi:hypothetical protein